MIKQAVSVIFDRRKNAPKKGYGMVELRIFISRNIYMYISLESCSQIDWNEVAFNEKYADMKTKYNNVLSAMKLLGFPMNMDTFNIYAGFNKEEKHDIDTQNTMHTENYTNVYADQKKNLLIQSCVMDSQPALYANDMDSFVYSDNKEHDISFYTNKYQLKCNDTNN